MRRPGRRGARGDAGARPPTEVRDDGEVIYGLRAGLAVYARRPGDVLRVAFGAGVRGEIGDLGRFADARRIPIAEASEAELARIAGTPHHEGLCVLARPRRWTSAAQLGDALVRAKGAAIALDRVRNPYNVGAILRTAAFFGIDGALLGSIAPHPALAPDAVRVAEGGAEHLALSRTTDLADTLGRFRDRGIAVVAADGASTTPAIGFRFARPTVLVLGHEREGVSERVRAQCDAVIAIPGSGAIESLNVAVAAGLLIGELTRGAR